MSDVAKLELDGKTYELPIIRGTENEVGISIGSLRSESGAITLDPGFGNTGSCTSSITYLNGETGILQYRGYPIEQLAEHSRFLETSRLLIYGELPDDSEMNKFEERMGKYRELPRGVLNIIDQFPPEAHPMGVISASLSSLCAFYPENLGTDFSPEHKEEIIAQLMVQVKTIAAYFYRRTINKPGILSQSPHLNYSADFMNMMFGDKDYQIDPEVNKALDTLLILHADHEQNCSASTVRVIGSSKANLYASIAGGIDALWGQLHGGANQAVLEMLQDIQDNGGDYKKYIEKAKDKSDPFRLMGFGHRVYKNFDPRAQLIKAACDTILKNLGVNDPLLDIGKGLEEEALKDPYFVERKLYPNVDFYSGIIYRALGIPTNMFTVMFVLGRLPGWIAQWKEMIDDPKMKIARPRQIYTGATKRDYLPKNQR
jgi:citrate synthase